jgi:hypothetical protein
MITKHAEETLENCHTDECKQLLDYCLPPYHDQSLSLNDHETLFYPLREHQELRLEIELMGVQRVRLRWGNGDLIFPHTVENETFKNAVDPTRIMNDIIDGTAEITQVTTEGYNE